MKWNVRRNQHTHPRCAVRKQKVAPQKVARRMFKEKQMEPDAFEDLGSLEGIRTQTSDDWLSLWCAPGFDQKSDMDLFP